MDRLVRDGLVDKSWNANKYKGIVTRSVVVFVVRNGNPKHIKTWDDLVKPGVKVVVAEPAHLGRRALEHPRRLRRRAALRQDRQAGAGLPRDALQDNVVSQDKSARDALNTFLAGKGDVLLTYENEAILAQQKGQPVFYIIPKATIRIDTPLAVLDKSQNKPLAQAFVKFLYSEPAQEIWGRVGYRPVDKTARAQVQLPGAAVALHRRLAVPRRLGEGEHALLRPAERHHHEDRTEPWLASQPPELPAVRRRSVPTGTLLAAGTVLGYLSVIVLIPLAALVATSSHAGWHGIWQSVSNREAVAALELTLWISLAVALVDAVMGTLIAWVLVRDDFRGKEVVNALIDLPFALPTIVAGLTLLALYGPHGGSGDPPRRRRAGRSRSRSPS